VFLVDTSVWIAQTFAAHPNHVAAAAALAQATEQQPALFCRATQQSFLRLVSTPAIFQRYGVMGITNEDALAMLERFLALSNVAYRDEPAGLVPQWHQLARRRDAAPKVWMDAYLAAFAMAADLTLVTLDADFHQYAAAGLKAQVLAGS
jgi:toxin-antitoxin system PIN domain toxin